MHFQYAHIVSWAFEPTVGVDRGNVVVIDDDDVTWQMMGGSNLSVSNRFILGSEVTHR